MGNAGEKSELECFKSVGVGHDSLPIIYCLCSLGILTLSQKFTWYFKKLSYFILISAISYYKYLSAKITSTSCHI